MRFCFPLVSSLACGWVSFNELIFGLFLPKGPFLTLMALFITSFILWIVVSFLSRLAGILLILIGMLGFLMGKASFILFILGLLVLMFGKMAWLILLANVSLYLLCLMCI